ncbi:Folylpolyglutamate synthase, mitochondrial [Thelohanellus kitauei]|uniref:tetrahydrofolate synthase n=1 Tax=Thelohanellus kitauei TaxID=669202 RepID=A0A0C2MKF1_THEKT|nr:Folylpolyglutamate synthase, mitochondrial [Thelohanellus kitauei]
MSRLLVKHGIKIQQLNRLNLIHISGTKGKGSVSAMIEHILRAHGLKTGLFTSPHLVETRERIKINGSPLSYDQFSDYFFDVLGQLAVHLFKTAFHVFIREKVDYAIVETGVGGRFDPTNIVTRPLACVITQIDYDHTNILGNSLEEIAWNKAGIIKQHSSVFTTCTNPQNVLDVIQDETKSKIAKFHLINWTVQEEKIYKTNLNGYHQKINAKLASKVCEHVLYLNNPQNILSPTFKKGLLNVNWPGRCQKIRKQNIIYFLDGCHSPLSFEVCINWLLEEAGTSEKSLPKILVFNCIHGRNYKMFLSMLTRLPINQVIFCPNYIEPNTGHYMENLPSDEEFNQQMMNCHEFRNYTSNVFGSETPIMVCNSVNETIDYIKNEFGDEHDVHVFVVGSLHLVGCFLQIIQN